MGKGWLIATCTTELSGSVYILVNAVVAQLCTFVNSLNCACKQADFTGCKLHLHEADGLKARGVGIWPPLTTPDWVVSHMVAVHTQT